MKIEKGIGKPRNEWDKEVKKRKVLLEGDYW